MNGIFSFSTKPIKVMGQMGLVAVGAGGLYLGYILTRYFIFRDMVPGWSSLIATVLILGGLQLIAIWVSGEYLGRLFEESKQRPLYFFKQRPGEKE
jgi:hypothetical protein